MLSKKQSNFKGKLKYEYSFNNHPTNTEIILMKYQVSLMVPIWSLEASDSIASRHSTIRYNKST